MITIGDYELFIYTVDGESTEPQSYDNEPFSYTAIVRTKNDNRWFVAMCNDIPCDNCILADDCKEGTNCNDVIAKYLVDNHPELLI